MTEMKAELRSEMRTGFAEMHLEIQDIKAILRDHSRRITVLEQ